MDPIALRGAWWAFLAVRRTRRQLRDRPVEAVRLRPPRRCSDRAERGLGAVVRRLEPSCLERALVLQCWLACRGDRRAVVIGVTAPGPGFRAHAWLDGEPQSEFQEIARVAP